MQDDIDGDDSDDGDDGVDGGGGVVGDDVEKQSWPDYPECIQP